MHQYAFTQPRLMIDVLHPANELPEFAADVVKGLSSNPKRLSPLYLYDAHGSMLFEQISCLPEYYLTRTERDILHSCARDISEYSRGSMTLVELGSGNSDKTRLLIDALIRRQGTLCYIPIDISYPAVAQSARRLIKDYPSLNIVAKIADYNVGLCRLMDAGHQGQKLFVFMGSNLGNFDPVGALHLLAAIRNSMSTDDYLMLGNDLAKDESVLIPAYNDTQGVTAAFNLNILRRINRELGGNFDLCLFDHLALYNRSRQRIEMHLKSKERQRVLIGIVGMSFQFEQGETIHTENSYKYTIEQLDNLFRAAGFSLVKRWADSRRRFSISLLTTGFRNNQYKLK